MSTQFEGRIEYKRHPVLVLFTGLANLFLIAFALDATLSVLDDAMRFTGLGAALFDIRNLVAAGVATAALLMLLVVLFIPQLPKRVLLPPVLYALWCAVGAPPLDMHEGTGPILSVLQLALALGAFVLVHMHSGHWLLKASRLAVKDRLVLRTFGALGILVVFVPLLAVPGLLVAFTNQIEQMSNRYIQFNPGGIDVQETTLVKNGHTVHLVGMMHIGEPTAYDALFASFPADALVMPEGVSDRKNLLAGKFNYHRLARALGLEQQPDVSAEPGAPATTGAPQPGAATGPVVEATTRHDGRAVLRADVDVSDFSAVTLRFLGDLGELYDSPALRDAVTRFQALSRNYSEEDIAAVFDDILTRRNAHLIEAFDANAASHDAIIIPWGALHMPGLEAALNARGYVRTETRVIRLANYRTIIAALADRR